MADAKADCIFCKIVGGKIGSSGVYEDAHVLAFLDVNPASKGHLLVIPKKHYEQITDIPDTELAHLAKATRELSRALRTSTKCDGCNIIQNNGKAAGQLIFHSHFHIIPRFKDDHLQIRWVARLAYDGEEEKEKYRKMIGDAMRQKKL